MNFEATPNKVTIYIPEIFLKTQSVIFAIFMLFISTTSSAETARNLPMDRVYQGPIRLPDFSGREREYSRFRTKITNEMKTGPNFAGHYAIITIGCGTGCNFSFVGDVATGKLFDFPYGGEGYYVLGLQYNVKEKYISAKWVNLEENSCIYDFLEWDGKKFTSSGPKVIGSREICDLP